MRKDFPRLGKGLTVTLSPLFFAMLVYLLLSRIQIRNIIVIDEEYTGHANLIENVLGQLSKSAAALQHGILFNQIGKLSRAHHYAWTGYRSKGRGLAKVKDTEVLSLVSRLDFQNLFVGGLHQL